MLTRRCQCHFSNFHANWHLLNFFVNLWYASNAVSANTYFLFYHRKHLMNAMIWVLLVLCLIPIPQVVAMPEKVDYKYHFQNFSISSLSEIKHLEGTAHDGDAVPERNFLLEKNDTLFVCNPSQPNGKNLILLI